MLWWEWWLGDGAYRTCVGVLTRYVVDAAVQAALSFHQVFFNTYINFYRQYIEHAMADIKGHAMWRQQHTRNSLPMLQACMKLTVHLTNVRIKKPWQAVPDRKYPGFHHGTPHYP